VYNCEDGWIRLQERNAANGMCVQFNKVARSWTEAEKHCADQIGNLMDVDYLNQLVVYRGEISTPLGQLLVNGTCTS